jgi:hypothetical protein
MMARGEVEDDNVTLRAYIDALPAGAPPPRDREARRQRMVPFLRAQAAREHGRARRRRVVRRAGFALTFLGGVAGALALFGVPRGWLGAPVSRPDATVAVLDGTLWLQESGAARRALHTGEASGVDGSDMLAAPADAEARVSLADTATLTLAPSSSVGTVLAAADAPEAAPTFEAVRLVSGRAHLKVKKLHAGQRFHVLTPDADVQVRGTEFDVELRPGQTPGTCVRVQEGLVAVQAGGEHLVVPGQSWGCEAPVAAMPAPAPVEAPVRIATSRRAAAPVRETASDLRAQNALFQTALQAERDGRFADAAALYRKLLARSPHGPLSQQARANLAVVARPR